MKHLSAFYIQAWSGSGQIYDRGVTYYRANKVQSIFFNHDFETFEAHVQGTALYTVLVELTDGGEIGYTDCDCPANSRFGVCKHVVAVLLELANIVDSNALKLPSIAAFQQRNRSSGAPSSANTYQSYRIADRFIQAFHASTSPLDVNLFDESRSGRAERSTVRAEYILSIYSHPDHDRLLLGVEMKVGISRTYVVKKIGEFLDAVTEGKSLRFTKNYSWDPATQQFTEPDRQLIDQLIQIWRNERFYTQRQWGTWRANQERFLIIPPSHAATILPLLAEAGAKWETGSHMRYGVGDPPLEFRVRPGTGDDYRLDLTELSETIWFPSYGCLYVGDTLYPLTGEQKSIFEQLNQLREGPGHALIPVSRDQVEPLLSTVLPQLDKLGRVNVDEQIETQVARVALETKIYLDREEELLSVRLEYVYGDVAIDPFQPDQMHRQQDGKLLVRDREREQTVMAILEQGPAHYNGQECYVEGEDDLFTFLFRIMPQLQEHAEVYMTDAVRAWLAPRDVAPRPSIGLDSSGDLLEIGFELDGIDPEDVERLLASVSERKSYHRLSNGAFLSLESDSFQLLDEIVYEMGVSRAELKRGKLELPVSRALHLDTVVHRFGTEGVHMRSSFRRLIRDMKNPDAMEFQVPSSLEADLRDYQQYGFQWLMTLARYRLGGILADEMGLGKTVQTIAFLLAQHEAKKRAAAEESRVMHDTKAVEGEEAEASDRPAMIVAPASLVYNWQAELARFAPSLRVGVVYGPAEERRQVLAQTDIDVYVTSYPMVRKDEQQFRERTFDTLVLDEAQAIKNERTLISVAVKRLRAQRCFALTGTPMENRIEELHSILDAVLPGLLPAGNLVRQWTPEQIGERVRPFILRRMKKDVLKQLPDKIETVHYTELTKQQKQLYVGYLGRIRQEAEEAIERDGFDKSRIKILAGLTRLKQLCCHPSLFVDDYKGRSGKLDDFMEFAENALAGGKRLLVFSQFASMLRMISDRLNKVDIDHFYLDGQTPSRERLMMADRFNEGERNMFLVSLKAGGTGLNLTGADTVVLFDLWWNPAVEEQAAGRAHRIGQKNIVQVIRLITRGTIEEKILELQQQKRELIDKVVLPGETPLSGLSEEDIRLLLQEMR